jgi:DNA-binding NtrC family response regulator
MLQYPWPGNIRELAAVIDRAVILGEGSRLDIKTAIGGGLAGSPASGPGGLVVVSRQQPEGSSQPLSAGRSEPLDESKILTLDEAMKRHIERVLDKVAGKIEGRGGAAAVLAINPHTLRARMRKLGVQWSKFRDSGRPEDALR